MRQLHPENGTFLLAEQNHLIPKVTWKQTQSHATFAVLQGCPGYL